MVYVKTNWKDRVVERPNTYTMVDNGNGTITLTPVPGQIIERGTPLNAENLNKIEDAIVETNAQLSAVEIDIDSRFLNVMNVGAIGDGLSHKLSSKYLTLDEAKIDFPHAVSLDDEIDLVSILKALSISSNIFIPKGTFLLNRQIDLNGLTRIEGFNRNQSVVMMVSDNSPIFTLNGDVIQLENLGLKYRNFQENFSNSIAILKNINVMNFINLSYLQIENAYIPIKATNNLFNWTVKNIRINAYAYRSLQLDGSGSTGCVFENIYTTNWKNHKIREKYQVGIGMHFQGFSESIISQINIEHVIATQAILINDCHNITINSFHIEGYEQSVGLLGSVIRLLSNSVVTINSMTMSFSGYRLDDSSKQGFNLVSLGKNCQMTFNGIKFHSMNEIETWEEKTQSVILEKITTDNLHNQGAIRIAIKDTFEDYCSLSVNGFVDDSDFWRENAHALNMSRYPFDLINFNNRVYFKNLSSSKEVYLSKRIDSGVWDVSDRNIFTTLIDDFNYVGEICVGRGDFSEPPCDVGVSRGEQWQSWIALSGTSQTLKKGDRIKIGGIDDKIFTLISEVYGFNSEYRINIEPVLPVAITTIRSLTYAKPKFVGWGRIEI